MQLRVLRSFRRELTLIKNKLARHHRAEIKLAHRCEPLFKHSKNCVGAVVLAPFRRARSASGARESQMRTERPVFLRNTKFGNSRFDAFSQRSQLRPGVNSNPEYARRLRRREESVSASPNFERTAFEAPQTFGNCLDLIWRLLSDELQCKVKRLWPYPFGVGREALNALQKTRDAHSDFGIEINTNEDSHCQVVW